MQDVEEAKVQLLMLYTQQTWKLNIVTEINIQNKNREQT